MTSSTGPNQPPAADEWAIRQLVERYANAADRADGGAVAALFTSTGELELWLDPTSTESVVRRGAAEIAAAISRLTPLRATQHVIASSVATIAGDTATGETRCNAHHIGADGHDQVLYLRYNDQYRRDAGQWLITRRELRVQWTAVHAVTEVANDAVLDRPHIESTGGEG